MRRAAILMIGLLMALPPAALAATEDAVLRAREGAANLLRGKYEAAITSFDAALKDTQLADVRRANILNDRGVAKWRLKQAREAIADFNEAIVLFPDYAVVYNNRGNALMELGEPEQAVLDFTRAIELAPSYGAAFNNRGNAYMTLEQTEKALKDFRKAVQLMPTNAVPYNGRGKAHSALGRPYAGMRDFSRALALNAKYSGARRNRGTALLKLGQDTAAVRDYTELIAQQPDQAELYFARGSAYARTRRYNAAVKDLSKAITLNPDNTDAYLERGSAFLKVKQLAKARDDLTTALAIDPENVEALAERAKTHLYLGAPEEAQADAEKAVSLDPKNPRALAARGQVYQKLERVDDAVSDYQAALATDAGLTLPRARLKKLGVEIPPRPKPQTIGEPVKGWVVSESPKGGYVATNRRYPKIRVRLEMYGPGIPEIVDWTLMKYSLKGIGLLRYRAGVVRDESRGDYEYTAIIDIWKNKIAAVEPHAWGKKQSKWEWKQASVTVTDPDGIANEVTLRKAPVENYNRGDQFWSSDNWWSRGIQPQPRPRPRKKRRKPSGDLFDWLFR